MMRQDTLRWHTLDTCCCVVQVDVPGHPTLGDPPDQSIPSQSGSGLILDSQKGIVLTTGSLFSQALSISDLEGQHHRPRQHQQHSDDCTIKVIQPSDRRESHRVAVSPGRLLGVWPCSKLQESLEKLFRGDGWSFEGDSPQDGDSPASKEGGPGADGTPQHYSVTKESCKAESPGNDIQWLSSFALIQMDHPIQTSPVSFSILPSADIIPGKAVVLSGTPFGSLCPPVFANSYAGGIVSNVAGPSNALILTDARCLPGTEGAPVFTEGDQNRDSEILGLVVVPMCWKTNQWVGLSVVCSLQEVLLALLRRLPGIAEEYLPRHLQRMIEVPLEPSHHQCHNFLDSIKLVKVGPSWGSGVVIHAKKQLLLTCRHVVVDAVNNNQTVFVSIDRGANTWQRARVVFATSHESVIDFAIIQLTGRGSGVLTEIPLADTWEGEPLFAVGFPLFGPKTTLRASVTSGHVSKVIRHRGRPVMLQTSCAIHPGSSGGALVSKENGHLLGIIANNCRDDTHNITIPHLNFGIPSTVFMEPLRQYIQSGDITHLRALNIYDKEVESLWKLQGPSRGDGEALKMTSKL